MATTIYQLTATIPANTPTNALAIEQVAIPACNVDSIDLEVPPGPAGLMGFYLAISGQQIIPFETGQFIVWDDRYDSWALDDFPQTGAWSVVGYNLDGVNGHSVVVRFHTSPFSTPTGTGMSVVINTTAVASPEVLIGS